MICDASVCDLVSAKVAGTKAGLLLEGAIETCLGAETRSQGDLDHRLVVQDDQVLGIFDTKAIDEGAEILTQPLIDSAGEIDLIGTKPARQTLQA